MGNRVGLMKGDGDGAPVSSGDNPTVDWVEISCKEPQEAWKFYGKLFGWTVDADPSDGSGGPIHGSIDTGSTGGARGGIGSSRDGSPSVDTLEEARVLVADFQMDYNCNRPHSSLQNLAPAVFAERWKDDEHQPARLS